MRHFTPAIVLGAALIATTAIPRGAAAQQPSLMLPSGGAGGQSGLITSATPLANTPPPLANSPAALANENLGLAATAPAIPKVPDVARDRRPAPR